jgi:Flp pilus assembly protein CpaB
MSAGKGECYVGRRRVVVVLALVVVVVAAAGYLAYKSWVAPAGDIPTLVFFRSDH